MALERYIKNLGKTREACQMCNATTFSPKYRYRPYQMIPDHIPQTLTVCKKCIYREVTGSRGLSKRMKENTLKDEGNA